MVGKYREDKVNDNGTLLRELWQQFSVRIQNGFFPREDSHKFAWGKKGKIKNP